MTWNGANAKLSQKPEREPLRYAAGVLSFPSFMRRKVRRLNSSVERAAVARGTRPAAQFKGGRCEAGWRGTPCNGPAHPSRYLPTCAMMNMNMAQSPCKMQDANAHGHATETAAMRDAPPRLQRCVPGPPLHHLGRVGIVNRTCDLWQASAVQ